MPPSLVERYERILAADPRSLVFVELARALLERGEATRAAEVCRQGLAHHPQSIQGRVVQGRALLAAGRVGAAVAVFEAAAAVEPGNPYALNLATESLVERELAGRALPLFEQAAALQPSSARARAWLEQARREAAELPPLPAEEEVAAADASPPAVLAEGVPAGTDPPSPRSADTAAEPLPPPAETVLGDAAPAAPPPLRHTPVPPPLRGPTPEPGSVASAGLLGDLPAPAAPVTLAAATAPAVPDADEAARIASAYEEEVRSRMLAAEPPQRHLPRRHFLAYAAVTLSALAVVGGAITYYAVRRAHRAEDAHELTARARRGLLRDTAGSLREASRALAAARELDPAGSEPRALAALAAALLWSDHRDPAARDLAAELRASGQAGDAAPAVRVLLAATPAERADALAAVEGSPPSTLPPVEAVSAQALLGGGDEGGAARRLEAVARSSPPSIRALAALGDLALGRGDPDEALRWYGAALSAHPTHPRAAIGAAEARLAVRRDLPAALSLLRSVEADPDSPPPVTDRLRLDLALARLLAAEGQRAAALDRLDRAAEREPAAPEVPLALAEIQLEAGACDRAEPEARRALDLARRAGVPVALPARVLLARAQLCRSRNRELLRDSDGQSARDLRILRAQARLASGDAPGAVAELEATGREGRMPAEAAGWYALALEALGRPIQAQAVLARLLSMPRPPVPALLAAARLATAAGKWEEAERHLRTASEREVRPSPDPEAVEPRCALGRLLFARGRAPEALTALSRAAALNPLHAEAQMALGESRLAVGDARGAREAFAAALAVSPRSGAALRGLAAAHLATGDPGEARRAADRALLADPTSPQSWLAAARAALAQGDHRGAQRCAEKARRLAGSGEAGAEARRILARAQGAKG